MFAPRRLQGIGGYIHDTLSDRHSYNTVVLVAPLMVEIYTRIAICTDNFMYNKTVSVLPSFMTYT